MLDIARDRRKTLKKEKEQRTIRKSQTTSNKYFFTFNTFLYRKNYILLENIFGKTYFIILHLHYSFFAWQVIGNAVIKQQHPYRYALVLLWPKILGNRLGILT